MKTTLIITAIVFICASTSFAQGTEEEITLSTYYPAPYGEYESLTIDDPDTVDDPLNPGEDTDLAIKNTESGTIAIEKAARLVPVDPATIINKADGMLICDKTDDNKIKKWDSTVNPPGTDPIPPEPLGDWVALGGAAAQEGTGYIRIGKTQICWGSGSVYIASGNKVAESDTIPFPVPFKSGTRPRVTITCSRRASMLGTTSKGGDEAWVNENDFRCVVYWVDYQSGGYSYDVDFDWMAIGEWDPNNP